MSVTSKARGLGRRLAWVWLTVRYGVANRLSNRKVTSPQSACTVVLTTHGKRRGSVYLTIEAIAAGSMRPSRLVLFVGLDEALPASLRRLERRGLEIRADQPGIGPHNKYLTYVESEPESNDPFVTADDDLLYPASWLADLVAMYEQFDRRPIVCHAAKIVTVSGDDLAPFRAWPQAARHQISGALFFEGAGGVLYPPSMRAALASRGREFMDLTPKADDIWLNRVAMDIGASVCKVATTRYLPYVPRYVAQSEGLFRDNKFANLNQAQLEATFPLADRMRLALRGSDSRSS